MSLSMERVLLGSSCWDRRDAGKPHGHACAPTRLGSSSIQAASVAGAPSEKLTMTIPTAPRAVSSMASARLASWRWRKSDMGEDLSFFQSSFPASHAPVTDRYGQAGSFD